MVNATDSPAVKALAIGLVASSPESWQDVRLLAEQLAGLGMRATVLAVEDCVEKADPQDLTDFRALPVVDRQPAIWFGDSRQEQALAAVAAEEQFDLLHIVGLWPSISAGLVETAYQLGIPVVLTLLQASRTCSCGSPGDFSGFFLPPGTRERCAECLSRVEPGMGGGAPPELELRRRYLLRVLSRCARVTLPEITPAFPDSMPADLDSRLTVSPTLRDARAWGQVYSEVSGDLSVPATDFRLSVVIPTFNRREWLGRCLAGFVNQTLAQSRFEVIVVDDHSDSPLDDLMASFRGELDLTYIRLPERRGPNAARNAGWRAATGEIVLIFDDDDRPTPRLLAEHMRAHVEHPEPNAAVLGFTGWDPELEISPAMYHVTQVGMQYFCYPAIKPRVPLPWHYYWTGRSSIKRQLLEESGGFDEGFPLPALDDIELAFRLREWNLKVYFEPRAVSYGMRELTTEDFCRRWENQGKGMAILLDRHPEPGLVDHFGLGSVQDKWEQLTGLAEKYRNDIASLEGTDLQVLRTIPVGSSGGHVLSAEDVLHSVYSALFEYHRLDAFVRAREGLCGSPELAPRSSNFLEASPTGQYAVSIVIPCWNRADYTQRCLGALADSTPDSLNFEVVLVDNGSTDGTAELLAGLEGDVQVITNATNLGFARACNQGAEAARGKHVLFLNNDTEPHPGWLEAMLRVATEEPDAGIVGAKLLYPDGTIQHAGVVFTGRAEGKFVVAGEHRDKDVFIDLLPYHLYRRMPADAPYVSKLRDFQAVTGACLLIDTALFRELGGFDETYRNGFEDIDLCMKVLKKGKRVIYTPKAVVTHHESISEGRNDHDLENARIFRERWLDFLVADDDRFYREDGFVVEQPQERLTVYQWNRHFAEAEELFEAGRFAEALAEYEAFLEADPGHPGARIKVAVIKQRLNLVEV